MSERATGAGDRQEDQDLDPALIDALRAPALNPQALDRLRTAVESEWRASVTENVPSWQSRHRRRILLAAAVSLVAVSAAWFVRVGADREQFGAVARLGVGNVEVRSMLVRHRALHVGDNLQAGDSLTAQGPVLVTLSRGGTVRIAADSVLDVTGANALRLRYGTLYVDLPPGHGVSDLRVATRAGTVEHMGTEFEVLSDQQEVRVRVREGQIRLRGLSKEVVVDAGVELLALPNGEISQRPFDTYGKEWLWIAAVAPDYEIEGQPLLGFLQWISRELGRRLEFADPESRQVAEQTILHGSVHGREPLDALANVLATTRLGFEVHGDTIRVHYAE